jgi:hypothetical protein
MRIAARENGLGGVGAAFNVQLMAIKAAQYSGVLATSDIAQGIYYAVENGADVINMSFGGYSRSQVEEDALTVAFGTAVLVAAAGNDGKVVNAFSALTNAPKPELKYLEHWLFDTTEQGATNDNDGIVDAGETVDLAIVIRNYWGKADPVSVKSEAWAEGAVQADPYVTMITDTVDYGAIGSFNWDDNGLI